MGGIGIIDDGYVLSKFTKLQMIKSLKQPSWVWILSGQFYRSYNFLVIQQVLLKSLYESKAEKT